MKRFRNSIIIAVAIVALGTMTSCNRGYGCPQFSLEEQIVKMVENHIEDLAFILE